VPSLGCGYAVCVLLALAGFGLLAVAQRNAAQGKGTEAWIAGIFGGSMAIGALALLGPMQRAAAAARDRERRRQERPDAPWLWEARWTAANGIAQSPGRHAGALLGFAVVALVMSSPVWFLLPRELARGNYAAWLGLLFPLFGGWILARAGVAAWRRHKYGPARFVAGEMPVPSGAEVAGMVLVPRAVVPTRAGCVSLACWSTTIVRSGGKSRQSETALARVEREIPPAAWENVPGEARLLVQLPVPEAPASTVDPATEAAPAIEWRLKVEMPTSGADFVAEFVLPVFAVPGRVASARPGGARTEDRAAVWSSVGLTEVVQPGAIGGHALQVAAGQGKRHLGGTLFAVVLIGAVATTLARAGAPIVFPIFFGVFALLPLWAAYALWHGGGERVWIERDALGVARRGVVRRIPRPDIIRLDTANDVAIGEHRYLRVVAVLRTEKPRRFPRRIALLTLLRGDEAAAAARAWIEERLTAATD
jgi:hypothetical protein